MASGPMEIDDDDDSNIGVPSPERKLQYLRTNRLLDRTTPFVLLDAENKNSPIVCGREICVSDDDDDPPVAKTTKQTAVNVSMVRQKRISKLAAIQKPAASGFVDLVSEKEANTSTQSLSNETIVAGVPAVTAEIKPRRLLTSSLEAIRNAYSSGVLDMDSEEELSARPEDSVEEAISEISDVIEIDDEYDDDAGHDNTKNT